jgi:hypothetical protein
VSKKGMSVSFCCRYLQRDFKWATTQASPKNVDPLPWRGAVDGPASSISTSCAAPEEPDSR